MKTLIRHANVFDGNHEALKMNANIVIEDNLITGVVEGPVSEEPFGRVVDAGGLTAIPGLTDCHEHLFLTAEINVMEQMRMDEIGVRSSKNAEEMLLRGFTSVRDAGGTILGLKNSIDNGYVDGPRIFPCHAAITQTSGHCDCRSSRTQERTLTGYMSPIMNHKSWVLADGVPEVLRAVRDQLFLGASQIKLMLGGGIASPYDHLYTLQLTFEEIEAAVKAASDFGTYVMAHIYTPAAMQRAARAGVMCFEHAQLMDDETARIISDKGIWVCPCPQFDPDGMGFHMEESMLKKWDIVATGVQTQAELINKYDLNFVYGTDLASNKDFAATHQLRDFRDYKKLFGSYRGLKAATGNVCELMKLTTYQNPYPEGKIGVIEPGAFADILLVKGNPVEDLDLISDGNNIRFVMKDGIIYRDDR